MVHLANKPAVTIPAEEYRRLVEMVMSPERERVEREPVTIAEAAELTGHPKRTIEKWSDRGHLPVLHRVPGPGRTGLVRVVDLRRVRELIENPPREGRPPRQA